MLSRLPTALIAAALTTGLAQPALAQAVSKAVGGPLAQAQRLASGNAAAAIQQIAAARAAAKTPAERAKVGQMAAYVYTRAGRFADAARELEAMGRGPGELAPYYYRAGQYDKAIQLARRAGGQQSQLLLAQALLQKGDKRGAATAYQALIRANGPHTDWLENLASLQFSYDKAGYLATVRQLIKQDPSPARFRTLLSSLKSQNMSDQARLTLFQLMRQTGNLTDAADVQEISKLAIIGGLPGVAVGAIADAQKANVVNTADPIIARILQKANADQAALTAQMPRMPGTPDGRMRAGNAMFGSNNYPGAAAAYRQVVASKATNADLARMLQGIAQLRSGDAAGGRQTFETVPKTSVFYDVAQIWSLYAVSARG